MSEENSEILKSDIEYAKSVVEEQKFSFCVDDDLNPKMVLIKIPLERVCISGEQGTVQLVGHFMMYLDYCKQIVVHKNTLKSKSGLIQPGSGQDLQVH